MYKKGKVEEAYQFLEQAMKRGLMLNKFCYTPLIHVFCRQGEYSRALDLLIKMTEGHKPDLVLYDALIHGLIAAGEVDVVLAMREKNVAKGSIAWWWYL